MAGPYSELELRYARPIAQALLSSASFRQWLFTGTDYADVAADAQPLGDEQAGLRSRGLKNPYWFNYWCGKDSRCECRVGSGIETDILVVFRHANDRRLAVHVEVKRPGDKLGDGQAASYPRRAACWANPATRPKTVPRHDDFVTVLVCGRDLAVNEQLRYFDRVAFHDEVGGRVPAYPEL